jgi:nicotinamide riboside transporter PnuC
MRVIMSLNGISIQLGLVCLYNQVILFFLCILLSSLAEMNLQIFFYTIDLFGALYRWLGRRNTSGDNQVSYP